MPKPGRPKTGAERRPYFINPAIGVVCVSPNDQFTDVLGRFAPPLAPWTRCPACNGLLSPIPQAEAAPLLQPGTRRTYQAFSRCGSCGQMYWRGAHAKRLEALIASAQRAVRTVTPTPSK